MTRILYSHNGVTGEFIIYSAYYKDKILYKGNGNAATADAINVAIREAERLAAVANIHALENEIMRVTNARLMEL